MNFVDRTLTCRDCNAEFLFTAGEQVFFQDKGFVNDPKRCKACRAKMILSNRNPVKETQVVCAECGTSTTVPFKPNRGTPVLCRSCFQKSHTVPVAVLTT